MGRPGELKRPQLPEGPLKDLIDALHDLHLRAGRPTLSDLAKALEGGVSRSRLHDAFASGRLPRWEVVDALVETLGSRARGTTPEKELDRFHALWQSAVSDNGRPEPSQEVLPRPHLSRRSPSVAAADSRGRASETETPLYMSSALFNRLKGSPWQERVEDGYLCFLTGDFRPPKPTHQYPREDMVIVYAHVNPQLRMAVTDYAREHAGELGWAPTPKQVAVAWLMLTPPPPASPPAMSR